MKNQFINLMVFLFLLSCSEKTVYYEYMIYKDYDFAILKHPWLKDTSFHFQFGLSDIVTKEYINDSLR